MSYMVLNIGWANCFEFTGPFETEHEAHMFGRQFLGEFMTVEAFNDEERLSDMFGAFECLDCGVNTSCIIGNGEYYMVHDHVWHEANPQDDGMLCIGCIERRLGRGLTSGDFTGAPVNTDGDRDRSDRLLDRLTRSDRHGMIRRNAGICCSGVRAAG